MDSKIEMNLKSMKIAGMVTFGERLIEIVSKSENDDILNHYLVADIKQIVEECKKALWKKRNSGMGKDIARADKLRDTLFVAMRKTLEGFAAFEGERAAAAKTLLAIFKKRKSIYRMSYSEQTQTVNIVVTELFSEQNAPLLESTGLTDFAQQLRDAQLAFWQLYDKRQEIESDLDRLPSAISFKQNMISLFRAFFTLIWLMRNQPGWNEIYLDVATEVKTEKFAGRVE